MRIYGLFVLLFGFIGLSGQVPDDPVSGSSIKFKIECANGDTLLNDPFCHFCPPDVAVEFYGVKVTAPNRRKKYIRHPFTLGQRSNGRYLTIQYDRDSLFFVPFVLTDFDSLGAAVAVLDTCARVPNTGGSIDTFRLNSNELELSLLGDGVGVVSVDLSGYLDNTDAQTLSIASNSLSISGGNSVDLSPYLDNTDAQTLSFSNNSLSITGGNSVDLSSLQDGTGTDDQTLTLSSNTLSIESGNSVDLSAYLDNTDQQLLSLVNNSLIIQFGNSVDLSQYLDDTVLSQEQVEDFAGAMVSGNTETLIAVSYDDATGKINYAVTPTLSSYTNDAGFLTSDYTFVLDADSGTPQTVDRTETVTITGGTNISTLVTATNSIAVSWSAALNDLSNVSAASPSSNDVLTWNGSNWISAAPSGGVTGSGTVNYLPLWTGSTALGNSYLSQTTNSIKIDALKALDFPGGTTAQRPTGSSGKFWYNTSVSIPQFHDGTAWRDVLTQSNAQSQGLGLWKQVGGTITQNTYNDRVSLGNSNPDGNNSLTVHNISSGINGIMIKGGFGATSQAALTLKTRVSGTHLEPWIIFQDVDKSLKFRHNSISYMTIDVPNNQLAFDGLLQKVKLGSGFGGNVGFTADRFNSSDFAVYEFVSRNGGTVADADLRFRIFNGLEIRNTYNSASEGRISFHTNIAGTTAERIRITNNGSLLIGRTSLNGSEKLSVQGDIYATGVAHLGNYVFNNLETLSGKNGYALKYNSGTGKIELQADNVGSNTDNQTLSITSNSLSISGGNSVDLSPYLDNTDSQTLLISGQTLSISGGNSVTLPGGGSIAVGSDSGSGTVTDTMSITGSNKLRVVYNEASKSFSVGTEENLDVVTRSSALTNHFAYWSGSSADAKLNYVSGFVVSGNDEIRFPFNSTILLPRGNTASRPTMLEAEAYYNTEEDRLQIQEGINIKDVAWTDDIPQAAYGEAYTTGAFRKYDLTDANVIDTLTSGNLSGVTHANGQLSVGTGQSGTYEVTYNLGIFGSFTANTTVTSRLRKNNSALFNQGGESHMTIGTQSGGISRGTLSGHMYIDLLAGNYMSIELSAINDVEITVEKATFSIRKIE